MPTMQAFLILLAVSNCGENTSPEDPLRSWRLTWNSVNCGWKPMASLGTKKASSVAAVQWVLGFCKPGSHLSVSSPQNITILLQNPEILSKF